MHIDTQGSGADLVLVHGWGNAFGRVRTARCASLRRTFDCISSICRGHGFSRDDGR